MRGRYQEILWQLTKLDCLWCFFQSHVKPGSRDKKVGGFALLPTPMHNLSPIWFTITGVSIVIIERVSLVTAANVGAIGIRAVVVTIVSSFINTFINI